MYCLQFNFLILLVRNNENNAYDTDAESFVTIAGKVFTMECFS